MLVPKLSHWLPALLLPFLFACGGQKDKPATTSEYKGVNVALMDTTVSPCENFYLYANGTWVRENPVPPTDSRWSSFNEVTDRNNLVLRQILDSALTADAEEGTNLQKIGDYFYCAMDSNKLAADGIEPVQPELDMTTDLTNAALPILNAHLHQRGVRTIFGLWVSQDDKKSTQYITGLYQGGLGLPDRDYYFREDDRSKGVREAYVKHIANILNLGGYTMADAEDAAQRIFALETAFAEPSLNRTERRNVDLTYNKLSLDELQALTPDYNWLDYFAAAGFPSQDSVLVDNPKFFEALNAQLSATDTKTWTDFYRWKILTATASRLTPELEAEDFAFYSTTLRGTKEMKPRWERALRDINGQMGEVLGQEFVKLTFSEATKERLDGMVDNLMVAFEARLTRLDWMSDETKEKARVKLGTFQRKLGYPDKWKDHTNLKISRDSYIANYFACRQWSWQRMTDKLGKPIDRTEWGMAPQIVNAYYNPAMNEIVFPAGILQAPFLDPEYDDASMYAGIGSVIGHELTHGFDDQGARFDEHGNLNNWWTEQDATNFAERTKMVEEQFNEYEALDSLYVNGKLTLGENIADLGGVAMAFEAYMKSLEGKEKKVIDGFTPEQRFFIAYAQVWKGNYTEEAMRQQVLTNPHAPGNFRVIGPLSNIPEFHQAFSCSAGDAMVREERKRPVIW